MSVEEIRAKVIELAEATRLGSLPITEKSQLALDMGLDWLDRMELVMEVEEALGINLHDEELDELKTVGDLVRAAQRAAGCGTTKPTTKE